MAISLTVNGETFLYPENNESPSWGEEASAWAVAVTAVLGTVSGPGDIVLTSAPIANNVSSPASVSNLAFSSATVRGAIVEYDVYRTSTLQELVECGTMYITYKSTAAEFGITTVGSDSSGVSFTINNSGQVLYTSSNMTGTSYSGTMKFRARAIPQ